MQETNIQTDCFSDIIKQEFKEAYQSFFQASLQKFLGVQKDLKTAHNACDKDFFARMNKYGIINGFCANKITGPIAAEHLTKLLSIPSRIESIIEYMYDNKENFKIGNKSNYDKTIEDELLNTFDKYLIQPSGQ